MEKPYCIKSGGKWTRFSDTCADDCIILAGTYVGTCKERPIYSCNCGANKCWAEKECIPNEEYCQIDREYCK